MSGVCDGFMSGTPKQPKQPPMTAPFLTIPRDCGKIYSRKPRHIKHRKKETTTEMENYPYAPAEIEPYWQTAWREKEAFKVTNDIETLSKKPKFYVLGMFPYTSGAGLHMGHAKNYVPTDVLANFRRMQGYHCLLYTSPSPRDGLLSRMPSSA